MTKPTDATSATRTVWYKVAEPGDLPEGRVKSASCGRETVCLTHFEGTYAAIDNRCPHQGGPLGEGSIEGGWLRCPWHGWDFHPTTGKPPGGYDDGVPVYPLEVREDGVYVAVQEEITQPRTTSDVLVETMTNWGVDTVFGMVGHSNLGLAEALRLAEDRGDLRYIGIRHEGAASFAASAYGKLTGRPAACFSIAGPGATNLLTGLWDAHVDSAPVLALTGQVPTKLIGRGAFQEVDLVAAFGQVAVWASEIASDSNHAELMTLACKHAIVSRGVSHLVFPDDLQTVPAPDAAADTPDGRIADFEIAPPENAITSALGALAQSERPVIVVGHGARFSMDEITELAVLLRCPVLTTFKAKGQISDSHPHGCGVLGRSGTPIASWFMNEADLLLVFGASFSNHTGITDKKKTIQVDFDRLALGRFHKVDIPVWGEIGVTCRELCEHLGSTEKNAADQAGWIDQRPELAERWAIWRAEKASRVRDLGAGVSSAAIFATMSEVIPENAIIAVDVGNNTYSFGRYFECAAQAVLMSGYLGSIGFGYPAAMGAYMATQGDDERFTGRPVICVSGDGGFGQYMGELNTAVKYGMKITHVLVNNGELGKISKEQRAGNWPVWQTQLSNPSFAEYATSCGALGIRVTDASELGAAIEKGLAHNGPALIEVMADASLI